MIYIFVLSLSLYCLIRDSAINTLFMLLVTTRQRWTEVEVKELHLYFNKYLMEKTVHGGFKDEQITGGVLQSRNPPLIIKKISNLNHK